MSAPRSAWLDFSRAVLRLLALAALGALVVDFGLPIDESTRGAIRILQLVVVAAFAVDVAVRLAWAEERRRHLVAHWFEITLVAALAVDLAFGLSFDGTRIFAGAWFHGVQAYLIARFALDVARVQAWLSRRSVRPALLLLGAYVVVALAGAALLMLPLSRAPEALPWSFTDAFFTATSAVCVTGLAVRDIGSELSFRGQALLLALIQLGGLGLVAVVCASGLLERGGLGLREARIVGDAVGLSSPGRLRRFLVFAIAFTVIVEALGAVALWFAVEETGTHGFDRAWWALFHSVSAFCNAGFGLHAASLAPWASDAGVLLTVAALIVIGGLGFAVHLDLLALRPLSLATLRWWRFRLSNSIHWPWRHRVFGGVAPHRLSLSTRIALATTAILLVVGALGFLASESAGVLAGATRERTWLESAVFSVTTRTAGFATFDFAAIGLPALLLALVLMVVGASPLSTGGGVKTTTVAIALLSVRAMARGRDDVDAFGRTIPRSAVHACIAIAMMYTIAVVVVTGALLTTQADVRFEGALFESVSALSTVGLTAGVTPKLDAEGRWIVAAAMIAGRIGPLACLWTFVSRSGGLRYRYPQENVVVS